jgi:hypothetical protein
VTEAEREPRVGCVAKTTVKDVAEADEIELTVPLLRVTTLPAAVGSKFAPRITSVAEATSSLAKLGVTTGGRSAAAVTVMVLAERPVPAATEGRGAHPTPSLVTTKAPLLGNRSTAFPPALPQVYETGFAVALALRSKTRRPTKAPS